MRSHLERSLSDLVVEIAIPLCVMGLVGSLVYFLLDLRSVYFPAGTGLLKYIFFLSIIATVLINRISYLMGRQTGVMYSVFLALVMILFLFVYSASLGSLPAGAGAALPINIAIVALIWFLSDRLTKSCHVGEDDDTMAEGLMSRAPRTRRAAAARQAKKPPSVVKQPDFKENLPRRHPGLAVVYFSCMSLVFFGVGLRMIPADESAVRFKTFWCMLFYMFCGFSLLMLTSFRGLRYYFAKRKMTVPRMIGTLWLGLGWVTVVLALALADVFPVPTHSGPRLRTIIPETVRTLATRGIVKSSKVKGFAKADQVDERRGYAKDTGGEEPGEMTSKDAEEPGEGPSRERSATRSFPEPKVGPGLEKAMRVLLIICGIVAVWLVLSGVFRALGRIGRYRRGAWAAFSNFFRRLAGLLGLARKLKPPKIKLPKRKRLRVKVKDRWGLACYRFTNPFRDPQLKERLSPADLIRYSYGALMAFAQDAGFPRRDDQTPYEFAVNLPEGLSMLAKPTRELTILFVRAEYAPQKVTPQDIAALKRFWQAYETTLSRVFR